MSEQDLLTPEEILEIAGILNENFPYIGKKDKRTVAIRQICEFVETKLEAQLAKAHKSKEVCPDKEKIYQTIKQYREQTIGEIADKIVALCQGTGEVPKARLETNVVLCPCIRGEPCAIHDKARLGRPDKEKIAETMYTLLSTAGFLISSSHSTPRWANIGHWRREAYLGFAKEILALILDIEQLDAMLVEARRTAKEQERDRIYNEMVLSLPTGECVAWDFIQWFKKYWESPEG